MSERLRCLNERSIITGWDFSTGAVKCLAFEATGKVVAEVRFPTDIWKGDPAKDAISELNLLQLEGQARASSRAIAHRLKELGRLEDWVAGGISATHHTSGRIDADHNQVRRAICWNDQTLQKYHQIGLERLGGQKKVEELIGGPWAIRYSLSHLVKDESELKPEAWARTYRILSHGSLAAGYLTGNFDTTSVSSAASTGIMDFRTGQWRREMLDAISESTPEGLKLRELAWKQLPRIVDHFEPVGPLAEHMALECGLPAETRPLIFPTSDDQQAGLVGGGAVDAGQLAIVLGTSAVVNSSSDRAAQEGGLDVMRLNWGPYLWMRCYNNGAELINRVFGQQPNFKELEAQASACPAGVGGLRVRPFTKPEPSLGVREPDFGWSREGASAGEKFRACLESLAQMITLGVRAHEAAGQKIARITVSGGIAQSELMCRILASMLNRTLERLESAEGPALGAAVTALAAMETHLRRQKDIDTPFTVADAVATMVRFSSPAQPDAELVQAYREMPLLV